MSGQLPHLDSCEGNGILGRESDSHFSKKVKETEKLDDTKDFVHVFQDHSGRVWELQLAGIWEDYKRCMGQYENLGVWNDTGILD